MRQASRQQKPWPLLRQPLQEMSVVSPGGAGRHALPPSGLPVRANSQRSASLAEANRPHWVITFDAIAVTIPVFIEETFRSLGGIFERGEKAKVCRLIDVLVV